MSKNKIEMTYPEKVVVAEVMKDHTKKELAILFVRASDSYFIMAEWIENEFGEFEVDRKNNELIFKNPPFSEAI